jgi:hypothetical protein
MLAYFMRLSNLYFLIVFSLILSACAGGGGGGTSSGVSPFTAWSAVAPNTATPLSGSSTTGSSSSSSSSYSASGNVTFDSSRNFTAISLTSGSGATASFSSTSGDTISQGMGNGTVFAVNKQGIGAIVTNPYDATFEYQTFGAWGAYAGGPQPSNANAVSLGSITPVTGMPATGMVNFAGFASGLYYQGTGGYFTTANMSAGVDFAARTVALTTSNTFVTGSVNGALVPASSLNMTGYGTYATGTSRFAGTLSTANGMIGTMTGQFYGPNANEIGGTYYATGSQGYTVGGFGGKR